MDSIIKLIEPLSEKISPFRALPSFPLYLVMKKVSSKITDCEEFELILEWKEHLKVKDAA